MLNSKGLKFSEAENEFKRSMSQLTAEQQRQYGFRTESMFAYVAGAMGKCHLIKQEDCGHWFVSDDNFSIPDYRIFLKTGETFLVEVKNETKKKVTFKQEYLNKLKEYSDLNQVPLRIAIYWQVLGVWTFNDPIDFEEQNEKLFITIDAAMAKSQISILGDVMLATKPSLSIRMICDQEKTSALDGNGQCQVCFSDVQQFCDNQLIANDIERKIAFQLLLSSQWDEIEHIEIVDNKIAWIEYTYKPEYYDAENGFANIGFLNSIISLKYKSATAGENGIDSISPQGDPEDFEIFIPEDYKGEALPIWRFILQPNKEYKS